MEVLTKWRKLRVSPKWIFFICAKSKPALIGTIEGSESDKSAIHKMAIPRFTRRDLRGDLSATQWVAADYIDSANEIGVLYG